MKQGVVWFVLLPLVVLAGLGGRSAAAATSCVVPDGSSHPTFYTGVVNVTSCSPRMFNAFVARFGSALKPQLVTVAGCDIQMYNLDPTGATAPQEGHRVFGNLRIDAAGHEVWIADHPVALTRTEFDILDVLSAQPRLALSRRQLIDTVWDTAWVGDEHVVDVHVANLRKKLDDDPTEPRYITTIRGVGYRMGRG